MAKMTVEAKLNQGTGARSSRIKVERKEPKKKRLVVDKMERKYSPTLVYPPLDIDAQNILADELKDWASKTSALRIERFALEKGMNPYKFKKLRDKNEYFAEAYQTAELFFACKYAEGGLRKELDTGLVHRHLWMVDPEYYNRTTELDREKLDASKKEQSHGNTTYIVQMDSYEKTTETPTE